MFHILTPFSSWENPISLFTTDFDPAPYHYYDMVFFFILAVLCSALAGYFIRAVAYAMHLRRTYDRRLGLRIAPFAIGAVIALGFGMIEYPIGHFMLLTNREVIDDMFVSTNLTSDAPELTHLGTIRLYSDILIFLTYVSLAQRFGGSWHSPSIVINLICFVIVRGLSTVVSATVAIPR